MNCRSKKEDNFVNGKTSALLRKEIQADLKWNEVDVDVVAECTYFTTIESK
jgi:glyceraldehyde 3-phosphate dehydrogenase